MTRFPDFLQAREDWLIDRVLHYAVERGYARFTSTLHEAWRQSVRGLSAAFVDGLRQPVASLELSPEATYADEPLSAFGVLEARRHRERGIPFAMFLGFFKYYRRAYLDAVEAAPADSIDRDACRRFLGLAFDRVELGFSQEWVRVAVPQGLQELQAANRRMTNEKNRYLTAFESLADPVLLLDRSGCVVAVNLRAADLLGLAQERYYDSSAALLGQPVEDAAAALAPQVRAFLAGDGATAEFDLSLPCGGERRDYRVKLSAMRDVSRKFDGLLVTLSDETAQRRAEAEVARHRQQLIVEVAERTAELRAANERLQQEMAERQRAEAELILLERSRAVGDMAAGISHNLNNILTGIRCPAEYIGMISREPRVLEQAQIISRCAERATELVSRLHRTLRGTGDRVALQRLVPRQPIEDAVEQARSAARQRPVAIRVEAVLGDLPTILSSPTELHDVVLNMLLNAVEALPRGGTVVLRARRDAGSLLLEVADDGVGMDEATRRRVFEPFFTTRSSVGSGLGLYTARVAVETWGGTIAVASQLGVGTTFTVTIPACADDDATTALAAPAQ